MTDEPIWIGISQPELADLRARLTAAEAENRKLALHVISSDGQVR